MAKDIDPKLNVKEMRIRTPGQALSYLTQGFPSRKRVLY